jgi:predicted ATP-dependent endonuclease of OLD family
MWELLPKDILKQKQIPQALSALHKDPFFVELNDIVHTYLQMDLQFELSENRFVFFLKDTFGCRYDLKDLSSGDQSMLLIILTIFGYDLEGGLLVIDEPELHLHPQRQKEFLSLIETISQKYSLQVILATHSPLMINEKNIPNVYRFNKEHLETSIHHPAHSVFYDEAELIQMLKFENIAKVFFVDTIIMVE